MIFWFSGTGNSRFVAERIAQTVGDEVTSINTEIGVGERTTYQCDKPIVFVVPTYAWRIPKVVDAFIRHNEFVGDRRAYFVLTCGSEAGNAQKYIKRLCSDKGMAFMGAPEVMMPDNFTPLFRGAPDNRQNATIIDNAKTYIDKVAATVKTGAVFEDKKVSHADCFNSAVVNPIFYAFFKSPKTFAANADCIGCGKCAELCPTANITMFNGKPVFGEKCAVCLSCVGHCPSHAVRCRFSKGTDGHYLFEDISTL